MSRGTFAQGLMRGTPPAPQRFDMPAPPHVLRQAMSRHAGLERDAEGLRQALGVIARIEKAHAGEPALLNMTAAAKLVTAAALARRESRGGHWRSDHPATEKTGLRTFLTLAEAEKIAAENSPSARRHAAP